MTHVKDITSNTAHIVYKESRGYVFQSNVYPSYDAARSTFDKIRLTRRSTEGLWLFELGSKKHIAFVNKHPAESFLPFE